MVSAGRTSAARDEVGVTADETRLSFDVTVTLRDPIGDHQQYETHYRLDLGDLMPYTMIDRQDDEALDTERPPRRAVADGRK